MADLNPVLDAAKRGTAATNTAALSIEADVAKTPELQEVVKESVAEISMADQIIALTKDNAELRSQNSNNKIFEAAGGHDAQVAMQTRLTADMAKVTALEDARSDIIDDTPTGIGLFDQLINGFRTIQVDAELEDAKSNVETSTNNIQRTTQSQESFAKTIATNEKDVTEATIAANTKKIAAIATGAAAEQDLKNIETNADMQLKVAGMKRAETTALIQIQQLEDNQRRMSWQATDRKDKETMLEDDSVLINRARVANGLQPQSKEQNAAGLRNEPELYQTHRRQGSAPRIMFGPDAASVQKHKRMSDPEGNVPLTKTGELFDTVEKTMWDEFSSPYIDPATGKEVRARGVPKTQEEVDNFYQSRILATTTTMRHNIIQGDQSNIFHAPPMDVLTTRPLVTDTEYFKQVIKSKGMTEFNTQAMWDAGVAAMSAGSITPEQLAEGIDAMHTAAANYNSTVNDDFYRHAVDSQTSYFTAVKKPSEGFTELLLDQARFTPISDIRGAPRVVRPRFQISDQMDYTANLQLAIKLFAAQPRQDSASNIAPEADTTGVQ